MKYSVLFFLIRSVIRSVVMFTIDFSSSDRHPLYIQIYNYIKERIEKGELKAKSKLPSKRELSAHLKVSVITVENAYMQLIAEGYVYTKPGSGFYVEQFRSDFKNGAFEAPRDLEKETKPVDNEILYDFRTNRIDTSAFPFSVWAKLAREVLSERSEEILNACPPQGTMKLREQISVYLKNFRGIDASPERIIVGAGSEYLIGLLIQLLGRDNAYGVENPGYTKTYKIFSANSSRVFPVPMDDKGASAQAISGFGINVIHVTPSHHFPLGTVMPVARRRELLDWADKKPSRYIIEDDYDSEFRYQGKPIPALRGMESDKVIYINTFAKSLAPSIRIGFMVLPDELYRQFENKLGFYSCTVPVFEQLTLAKFMGEGHFERHINRMKKIYKQRRDLLCGKIRACFKETVKIFGAEAGMHVLLRVDNGMSEEELLQSAKSVGVKCYGLKSFYSFPVSDMPDNVVVLGYSGLDEKQIDSGIEALRSAWIKKK